MDVLIDFGVGIAFIAAIVVFIAIAGSLALILFILICAVVEEQIEKYKFPKKIFSLLFYVVLFSPIVFFVVLDAPNIGKSIREFYHAQTTPQD